MNLFEMSLKIESCKVCCPSIFLGMGASNSNNVDQYSSLLGRAAAEVRKETLRLTLKGASSPKISRKKVTQW